MARISGFIIPVELSSRPMPIQCRWRICACEWVSGSFTSTILEKTGSTRSGLNKVCRLSQAVPILSASEESDPHLLKTAAGVAAFQQRRDEAPWRGQQLLDQIAECARGRDITALRDLTEEIPAMRTWLMLDNFDRRKVNRNLRQYVTGNTERQWLRGGVQ